MKHLLFALLILLCFSSSKAQDSEPIILGTKHSIHSDVLNEDREYWVSLSESSDALQTDVQDCS